MSQTEAVAPVAVAMVNWNGWRDTIACLESLERLTYPEVALVVCDNASTDDSVERIADWAESRHWTWNMVEDDGVRIRGSAQVAPSCKLVIIRSTRNRGFAGGTNVAIRHALTTERLYRYVWALNTDTVVEAESLARAVGALENNLGAGSAQSLLLWARRPELLDSAGLKLLRRGGAQDILHHRPRVDLEARINGREVAEIFGCCGAAALYRVSALKVVGLFDESLFQAYEDVDLACRLRQHNFGAILVRDSIVYHIGGISRDRKKRGLRWWTSHRNKLRLVARWYPILLALPILAFGVVRALVAAIRSSEVSVGIWARLPATLWHDWRGGPKQSERLRIVRLGTRSFF